MWIQPSSSLSLTNRLVAPPLQTLPSEIWIHHHPRLKIAQIVSSTTVSVLGNSKSMDKLIQMTLRPYVAESGGYVDTTLILSLPDELAYSPNLPEPYR